MAKASAAPAAAFPFAPDEIVVCLQSFAGYPEMVVKAGALLRADSEAVRRHPNMFAKQGLSDQEMRNLVESRQPQREISEHVPRFDQPKPLIDEDCVLCVKTVRGIGDGDVHLARPVAIPVGAKLPKDDKIVKAFREHFVPICPDGLTRDTAVLALTDRYEYRRDDNGAFIEEQDPQLRLRYGNFHRFLIHYAGTWVARNDPDVAANPARYQLLLS